nr:unnamed protein product [Callosobruchus chinensis]
MFGIVLSLVLQEEGGGNRQYIELLSDAGKLLTDIHHTETVAKNHKNEVKQTLNEASVDDLLFGSNLGDKPKTSKNLEKSKTVNQNISTINNSKRAFKLSQSSSLQAGVSPRWTPAPTDPPLQSSPQRTGTFNISQEPAPRAAQLSQGKDLQEIEQVNKPAGSLLFFHSEWSKITDDKMLLSWIKGSPNRLPHKKALLNYAKRIAQYGNYKHDSHQYVSNIFLRKKQDGSERVILNLKSLNKFIKTAHFKMEDQKLIQLPKYSDTWDPELVLDFLRGTPNGEISLETLTKKLAVLLALCTG